MNIEAITTTINTASVDVEALATLTAYEVHELATESTTTTYNNGDPYDLGIEAEAVALTTIWQGEHAHYLPILTVSTEETPIVRDAWAAIGDWGHAHGLDVAVSVVPSVLNDHVDTVVAMVCAGLEREQAEGVYRDLSSAVRYALID